MHARVRWLTPLTILAFGAACGLDPVKGDVPKGGGADASNDAPPGDASLDAGDDSKLKSAFPRLNQVRTLSPHNAFARDEPLFDQLFYHRARGLELDLHRGDDGKWDVYHLAVVDSRTSCETLVDCLRVLRAFHEAVPEHEVVTVFLDMSDDFDANHTPEELDTTLQNELATAIFTPADLVATCPSATLIRNAIQPPCGWPTLDALRGKFLFAMTGTGADKACEGTGSLRTYAGSNAKGHPVFIAPLLSDACTITKYDAVDDVVFLNLDGDHVSFGPTVAARNLLVRAFKGGFTTRGGFNDQASFDNAKASLVNFIASDLVNADADPFVKLRLPNGFPFECRVAADCSASLAEKGEFVAAKIVSSDIGGASDAALFRHLDAPQANGFTEWKVAVSAASSHVEPNAKACLVARAGVDADAPMAAVCRLADANRARLLIRKTKGGSTEETSFTMPAAYSDESAFFLKLGVTPAGASTEVVGSVSVDGVTFVDAPKVSVPALLTKQGLAIASNGTAEVRFLFAGLVETANGASQPVALTSLAETSLAGASGAFTSGLVP